MASLLKRHGLDAAGWIGVVCTQDTHGQRLGHAILRRSRGTRQITDKRIELFWPLLRTIPQRDAMDVILHEVAHAICMERQLRANPTGPVDRGHGSEWRRVAQSIGGTARETLYSHHS